MVNILNKSSVHVCSENHEEFCIELRKRFGTVANYVALQEALYYLYADYSGFHVFKLTPDGRVFL